MGTKSVDDYEKTKIEELILEIREAKTNWITKLGNFFCKIFDHIFFKLHANNFMYAYN